MKKILLILLVCVSCTSKKAPKVFEGRAMTISYAVQIGDSLDLQKEIEVEAEIFSLFSEVHEIYNNWNPDSEVSRLNSARAFQKIPLSPALATFLKRVDSVVQMTDGRFDPTVRKDGQIEAIGWDKIHFDETFFWKDHDLTSLDFGGVAKGFAVDLLVERLKKLGCENVYVEWGGEIKTSGKHPANRPWKIAVLGIESLFELQNEAVATSGNYLQNWEHDGKTFTHIINPLTKKPLEITPESIKSVTVFSSNCLEADALATSLMLLSSKDEAEKWAENHGIKILIY